MPTILLADPAAEQSEPLVKALGTARWMVQRRPDAASVLATAEKGRVAAVLVAEPFGQESGFALADAIAARAPAVPVVVLCAPEAPGLAAHREAARPARAYVDPGLPPDRIASEVLRAVRTVPGVARPSTGQQAVIAALAELDAMRPDPARPPTPAGVQRADPAPRAELEALHRRVRELELQKLVLEQALEKRDAEHKLTLSTRDEMLRHLELALEALTQDLSNAATGLAEQQDRAGQSETRLFRVEDELKQLHGQLAGEVGQAHELRRELGEARGQLLAAELDALGLREALQRAVGDAQAVYQRAMEAEAQRSDLIRALELARTKTEAAELAAQEHRLALEAAARDLAAEKKHHQDQVARLKRKLVKAEAGLERLAAAQARVQELEALLALPARAASGR